MKVLHLVLYSNTTQQECYDIMYQLTSKFYKKFANVKTIYYKYDKIDENFSLNDDILSIKGTESFVPGVLDKTLKTFEYVIDNSILDDYDIVIRSNISTIIDFNLLIKELENTGVPDYAGGKIENLQWLGGGITDDTWYGTIFVTGTSIILSPNAVRNIVKNKDEIKLDIIDDVSIAIFFKTHNDGKVYPPKLYPYLMNTPCFFRNTKDNNIVFLKNEFLNFIRQNKTIFYRNLCNFNRVDRRLDIVQMKIIIEYLTSQYKKLS